MFRRVVQGAAIRSTSAAGEDQFRLGSFVPFHPPRSAQVPVVNSFDHLVGTGDQRLKSSHIQHQVATNRVLHYPLATERVERR
jgi:hypothetical protein